jgi:hypothetical protein
MQPSTSPTKFEVVWRTFGCLTFVLGENFCRKWLGLKC